MHEHEPPRERVSVLDLADEHLREQDGEEREREAHDARSLAPRARSCQPTSKRPIPNTAVARTWT